MTPIHCQYKEKENGWPHPPTTEINTRSYINVLAARRRLRKEWDAEEAMVKYFQGK